MSGDKQEADIACGIESNRFYKLKKPGASADGKSYTLASHLLFNYYLALLLYTSVQPEISECKSAIDSLRLKFRLPR